MRELWLGLRSGFLWVVSVTHFVIFCPVMVLLGLVLSKRATDPFLRGFCRNIVRLTGARLEIRRSPGSTTERTHFLAANHVNIFDPFVVYMAARGVARGLELESHFKVPIYGWLMKSFGNVPVPNRISRAGLARMREKTRETLESGTNLIVFPEGTRTRNGSMGPFRSGMFRMAVDLQIPIIPVTLEGAYELKSVHRARLRPSTLVLHVHDVIEPGDDPEALRKRVREVVNGPFQTANGEIPPESAVDPPK